MIVTTIGQAPGPNTPKSRPLRGDSGRRIAKLMGLDLDAALELLRPRNLLREFPGKAEKGDAFPAAVAREIARRSRLRGDHVVLLGRHVAAAFGAAREPYLGWFKLRGRWAVVVPHPSGVNRWYNSPANRRRARRVLRALRSGRRVSATT